MIDSAYKTPVIIIHHPKERIAKCSLRYLRGRKDFTFFKARPDFHFDATHHILLSTEGSPLSEKDAGHPLLILDSSWRLLPSLMKHIQGRPLMRSLPAGITTAYPRVSKISVDPPRGLASVEALFVAKWILGEKNISLLDNYYWKEKFLSQFESSQII